MGNDKEKADTRQQTPRVGPEDNRDGERYERERTRDILACRIMKGPNRIVKGQRKT